MLIFDDVYKLTILLGSLNQRGRDGMGIINCNGKPEKRDHLEEITVDGRQILKRFLMIQGVTLWTGFMCLRIGTTGVLGLRVP
jgi:hypothetical protein